MAEAEQGTTVAVTSKGQATIPKEFREALGIETPGRVRFVERADGEIVVRPVPRPAEVRGSLAAAAEGTDDAAAGSATEALRAERDRDAAALEELVSSEETESEDTTSGS